MTRSLWLFPLGAFLVAADSPQRYDWSTTDLSYIGKYAKEAEPTRKLCASVIRAEPPAADRPTPAEAKTLKDCDSEVLYYGLGMAVDPVKARKCALLEDEREPNGGPSHPYYGRGMLAIIYANGIGAGQDYDVATHMACGLDNAPGDNEPRLEKLGKLKAGKIAKPDFDNCSDISSGASAGMCAGHESAVADQARDRRIEQIARHWSPDARRLFAILKKSAENYFMTAHEMDCFRGTLQSACTIGGTNQDMESFIAVVERLLRGDAAKLEAEADRARRRIASEAAKAPKEDMSWMPKEDKLWYDGNAHETQAKRAIFERDLVALAHAAFPTVTSHRIRRIFANM